MKGLDFSPIRGPEGNVEFLLWLVNVKDGENTYNSEEIEKVVEAAHKNFKMD